MADRAVVAVGMAAGTFGGARTAKLREARELRKEAWKLTRAAVIPDARDDVNVRRPLGRRR
jgi:hypothetical protein